MVLIAALGSEGGEWGEGWSRGSGHAPIGDRGRRGRIGRSHLGDAKGSLNSRLATSRTRPHSPSPSESSTHILSGYYLRPQITTGRSLGHPDTHNYNV